MNSRRRARHSAGLHGPTEDTGLEQSRDPLVVVPHDASPGWGSVATDETSTGHVLHARKQAQTLQETELDEHPSTRGDIEA